MRRTLALGIWLLLLLAWGPRDARAQVSAEYEQLVARLVVVETRLSSWEGERGPRYRATVAERSSLEAAVRSATEAHLSLAPPGPRGDLEARLRTERDLGALRSGQETEAPDPSDLETGTDLGPPDLPGPAAAAQPGLEIAAEARERGQETAEQARRRAEEIAEEARQRGRETAEDARDRARENAEDARDRARDLADEARDRARDAADDARDGLPGPP